MFSKPARLTLGDTVAIVSPSSGLPSAFPHIYEKGLDELRTRFGLKIKEMPAARADDRTLYRNPKLRAHDLNQAFADREVKAIFASIGGDDSLRILPYLDVALIRENPKIIMGYSDTTTVLSYLNQLGLVTFNGPSIMAGWSQLSSYPQTVETQLRELLFEAKACQYQAYSEYFDSYPRWENRDSVGSAGPAKPAPAWRIVQGSGRVRGELFGGCLEVLEFLKGTRFWPSPEFWAGKLLFLETSEDVPPPQVVKYALRNYGAQGAFEKLSGILFGRARGYSSEQNTELAQVVTDVVALEFERPDLPIVLDLDFGHTDPQWVMPLGVRAEFDLEERRFRLLEPAVT